MEIRDGQKLGAAIGQPLGAREPLALGTVPIAAANGRRPLPALWANPVMGSWCGGVGIFL
jgi:hypothetical protein